MNTHERGRRGRLSPAALMGGLLLAVMVLSGCGGGSSGPEPAPTDSAAETEETPATEEDTEAEEAEEETVAATGCPESVFTTFADLADLAEADGASIAAGLGVELPAEPPCTITWTDSEGEPSFTMFWPGMDFLDTYIALDAALASAGFQSAPGAQPNTTMHANADVKDLSTVAREPGSTIADAFGVPTAAMYGPDPR